MKAKEVAVIETNVLEIKKDMSMQDALIQIVQRQDIDPDRLEKFLDLQIKMENRQADQAFNKALSDFQGECPIITKKKKVAFNTTNYSFAPLDEIIHIIKPLLLKHGLSYSFDIKTEDKAATMITTIYHKDGSSKNSYYAFDPIGEGTMNQSQKRKSATTYAKRAGLENALGIVTAGEDDDANRAIDNKISRDQLAEIERLLTQTGVTKSAFLAHLKSNTFEELSEYDGKKAIFALKQRKSSCIK